jgi:hypothetical protein
VPASFGKDKEMICNIFDRKRAYIEKSAVKTGRKDTILPCQKRKKRLV